MRHLAEKLASPDFIHPPHELRYCLVTDPPDLRSERKNGKMKRNSEASDTELPGLELDRIKGELSFNWKGMLSYCYAEEKLWEGMWGERVLRNLDVSYTIPTVLTKRVVGAPRTSTNSPGSPLGRWHYREMFRIVRVRVQP